MLVHDGSDFLPVGSESFQGRHKVGWRPWVEPSLGAPRFRKNNVVPFLTSRILRIYDIWETHSSLLKNTHCHQCDTNKHNTQTNN